MEYINRTSGSRALHERATAVIPGGISHEIRYFAPYPFYVKSGKGSRVWDVDGNELLDFWIGHFALMLGHNHPVVEEAVRDQLERGMHWGMAHERELQLAEAVTRTVPCAESVRFCNTGAEATMYAVRLTKGYTGRSTVLKAEGGWHGFCTDLLVAVHGPFDRPESPGIPEEVQRSVKTFPFNDVEGASTAIRGEKDLSAVIVEPVLGAGGAIPADREFLKVLREETEARDVLLIFDEIITGFRLAVGGAQEYYGVVPDLVALGKILGGGLPVGAVAGTDDIMQLSSPTGGREGRRVSIGGGTFSANPLTTAAGLAALGYLEGHTDEYRRLALLGERIRSDVPKGLAEEGVETICTGTESLFQVHFPREAGVEIRNAGDVYEKTHRGLRENEFKLLLLNRGVYTMHGGGALSFAHTKEDVDHLVEAARAVAGDVKGAMG